MWCAINTKELAGWAHASIIAGVSFSLRFTIPSS